MESDHNGTTSSPPLIVVVEDEAPIRRFLRASLSAEGFRVVETATAQEGLRSITQQRPALVLLDLGLPDGDGLGIIQEIRGWSSLPIIVISARGEEKNKISALDAGADDYLTKPFAVGELLARIRVALRHAGRIERGGDGQTVLYAGPITIDLAARRVLRDNQEIRLTKLEFDLLAALTRNAGKVVTHRYLLKEVWGSHVMGDSHYVRVYMANLRKKLELNPSRPVYLLTE